MEETMDMSKKFVAEQCSNVRELISKQDNENNGKIGDVYAHYIIIYQILLAFEIELRIKYILEIKNIEYCHKHDLEYLFFMLPQDIQDNIINHFNYLSQPNYFQEELKKIKHSFEDWRYMKSKNGQEGLYMNIEFTSKFLDVVKKHSS